MNAAVVTVDGKTELDVEGLFARCRSVDSGAFDVSEFERFLSNEWGFDTEGLSGRRLQVLFDAIDADHDGKVGVSDLKTFLAPSKSTVRRVRGVFKRQRKHMETFRRFAVALRKDVMEKTRQTKAFPTGGNVSLDIAAFCAAAVKLGFSRWEASRIFDQLACDGSLGNQGLVDRTVVRLLCNYLGYKSTKPSLIQLFVEAFKADYPSGREAFKALGPNNGTVSKDQFVKSVTKYFGKADAELLFDELDVDDNPGTLMDRDLLICWHMSEPVDAWLTSGVLSPEKDLYDIIAPSLRRSRGSSGESASDDEEMSFSEDEGQSDANALEAARACLDQLGPRGAKNWLGPGAPLQCAIEARRPDMVRLLIEHLAEVGAYAKGDASMLHIAAYSDDVVTCRTLVEVMCNPNAVDICGQTPIFFARSVRMCEALVAASANLDSVSKYGQTCLHHVASNGLGTVLSWLAHRCSKQLLQLRDKYGASAAYYAVRAGLTRAKLLKLKLICPSAPQRPLRGRGALTIMNDPHDPRPRGGLEMRKNPVASKPRQTMPVWMALRPMPAEDQSGGQLKVLWNALEKAAVDQHVLTRVREGIKAAINFASGEDVVIALGPLIDRYSADHFTELSPNGFRLLIRKGLSITKEALSDAHIADIFSMVDMDASGYIDSAELASFVDPIFAMKMKFYNATTKRFQKARANFGVIDFIRQRVQEKSFGVLAMGYVKLDILFRRIETSGTNRVRPKEALKVVRNVFFKSSESSDLDKEVGKLFMVLDDDTAGGMNIEELMDLLDFERECVVVDPQSDKKVHAKTSKAIKKPSMISVVGVADVSSKRKTKRSAAKHKTIEESPKEIEEAVTLAC